MWRDKLFQGKTVSATLNKACMLVILLKTLLANYHYTYNERDLFSGEAADKY